MPAGVKIGDVFVEAHLKDDSYRRGLRDLVENTNNEEAEIGVGADTALASTSISHAARDRVVLLHAKVTGLGDVESAFARLSGLRSITDSIDSITGSIGRLDQSTPRIAGMATAMATLGGAVLAGSSNILTLGGSLASIVPAALALPGIFGGIAIGVGLTAVAMADMGTVLADLGPTFAGLQDQISANFWAGAAQPIRDLTYSLLPQLTTSLQTVSTNLGNFFGAGARALQMSLAGNVLNEMMGHLSDSIDIATGALEPLISAIVTLGSHGSAYLPRLAQWFTNLSTQFNAFIQRAEGNGSLTRWTETGIDALQALGSVVANVSRIFYGLYTAAQAAGGSTLQMLADGLGRVADVVSGPAFQGALTTLFRGAHGAMAGVLTALGPIGDMFVALAPTLARVMTIGGQVVGQFFGALATALSNPVFATGLNNLFDGILSGVQALLPAIPSLVSAFSTFLTVVGQVAALLGPLLGTAIQALAPVFQSLLTAIAPVAQALSGALASAITAIAPLIQDIAARIASFAAANPGLTASIIAVAGAGAMLIGALISVAPTVLGIVTAVAPLVTSMGGLSAIMGTLGTVFSAITGPIGLLVAGLVLAYASSEPFRNAINNLVTTIGTFVMTVVGQLLPIFSQLQAAFLLVVNGAIVPLVTAFTGMLLPVLNSLLPIITTIFTGISQTITNAMTIIQGIITTVTGLIRGNWSMAWSGIQQIFSGVWAQIQTIVTTAVNLVRTVITAGLTVIQTVVGSVLNAVANIFRAIFTGIGSFLSSTWNAMVQTTMNNVNNIRNAISNGFNMARAVLTSALNAMRSIAQSVWSAITSTISNAVSNARSAISSGFNAAQSAVSSALNSMRSIAASVFSSIVSVVSNGVSSARSAIASGFSAAVSTVSSAFSSMVSAAASGIGNVVSTAASLPGRIVGAVGNLGGLLVGAGQQVVQGMISGIQGMVGSLASTAASMARSALDAAKGALGIKSPSREFMKVGKWTGEGMVLGMEAMTRRVALAAEDMTHIPEANATVSGGVSMGRSVSQAVPTTNAATDTPRGIMYVTNHVTMQIDGQTIKTVQDMQEILEGLPQVSVAGGSQTYRKY